MKGNLGALKVREVLLHQQKHNSRRVENQKNLILVSLIDLDTQQSGHLLYQLCTDKRDVIDEKVQTDNPELFDQLEDCEAWAEQLQDLFVLVDDQTPTEPTAETQAILSNCRKGSLVVYKEGDAGWGLYAK